MWRAAAPQSSGGSFQEGDCSPGKMCLQLQQASPVFPGEKRILPFVYRLCNFIYFFR